MKLLTGNDLPTGDVTWWTGTGWSRHVEDAVDVGDQLQRRLAGERRARNLVRPALGNEDLGDHIGLVIAPVPAAQLAIGPIGNAKLDRSSDADLALLADQFDLCAFARLEQAKEVGLQLAPDLIARCAGDERAFGAVSADQTFLGQHAQGLPDGLPRHIIGQGQLNDGRYLAADFPHARLDMAAEDGRELMIARDAPAAEIGGSCGPATGAFRIGPG